jgi:hypothetical protein
MTVREQLEAFFSDAPNLLKLSRKQFQRILDKTVTHPYNECLLWIGAKYTNGYGIIHLRKIRQAPLNTHRVFYLTFNGPIEDGFEIGHSCDTRSCVLPKHLLKVLWHENRPGKNGTPWSGL